MTIKLIATDMDGTLLTDQKEISPAALAAIAAARAKGVKVVLATGRPLPGVARYVQQLGLSGEDEYVLTYNGAFVQNLAGNPVIEHPLGYQDFSRWNELAVQNQTYLHFETLNHFYTPNADMNLYISMESFLTHMPIRYRRPEQIPTGIEISKIMITDEPSKLTQFIKQVPASMYEDYQLTQSEDFFFEINSKAASKGTGVLELAQKLGIAPDEVMILGDQGNDLSMFKQPDFLKVAMGNAIPMIKEHATYVTATNEDDGFAKAVRKFALGE